MEQKRDLAIVLRSVPYEDRHRVVTALTEQHGRISALARNSIQSRRFGGALEPFAAAEWRFVERPGADLVRVEEAQIRRSYDGLRRDFQRLAMASAFNELMLRLAPEREPCSDLFRLHTNALAVLEELPDGEAGEASARVLLNAYLAKSLQWGGNQPQIQACLSCEVPLENLQPHLGLSCLVADAGWVCPACRTTEVRHVQGRGTQTLSQATLRVTAAALGDFLAALSVPIRQVLPQARASRQEHEALFAFLEALLAYHVPGFDQNPLKSLRFVSSRHALA